MKKVSIEYITSVLKSEMPHYSAAPDWYEILGFVYAHRIAGLFYSRAKALNIHMPCKAEKLLSSLFSAQMRRIAFMREQLKYISRELTALSVPCVFPKGSFLSNMKSEHEIYADGARVSNDIDVIVKSDEISGVANVLASLGFVQGRYDAAENKIIPFTRLEILTRRMNRGETAPYVKLTDRPEFPFIEVDINFSFGNTPGEYGDVLVDMVASRILYNGKVTLPVATPELFFIHLILHQYKESALYFMVERGKDLDLYKLADIYYLWNSGMLNKEILLESTEKYGIAKEMYVVLTQVREALSTECFDDFINGLAVGAEQPHVIDYSNKRIYAWTGTITKRLCAFDSRVLLKDITEQSNDN